MRTVRVFYSVRIRVGRGCRNAHRFLFIGLFIFSLLYAEFIVAYTSPVGPMTGLAMFVGGEGNEVENALGRLTITDECHLVVKGEGRYNLRVYDSSKERLLIFKSGRFNSTGFADIGFLLSPDKFKVGEKYIVILEAVSEPLPFLIRAGRVEFSFIVRRDIPRLGIGFYKDPVLNKTVIFARLEDEGKPIVGREVVFHYKHYGSNESFVYLGKAVTGSDGKARVVFEGDDNRLFLIKAEFEGDGTFEPVAADEVFTLSVEVNKLGAHIEGSYSVNGLLRRSKIYEELKARREDLEERAIIASKHRGLGVLSLDVKLRERKSVRKQDYVPKVRFVEDISEEDIEQLSLIEFLDILTEDGCPASILVDVAEILNNLNDLPYVVYKLGIILSKLDIALIPMIDGNGIVLYKIHVYEVTKKVAKTVVEKITETKTKWVKKTKTVTKTVKKRVKELVKLIKWVKKKQVTTYTYWDAFRWRWVTVKQVYYVWVPVIKWKEVWKTVTETVTETVTYWVKVTETVTRTVTKTIYETVKETKKENVNVYRINVAERKVINLESKEEMSVEDWLLSLIGLSKDVMQKITGFMMEKVVGPALNILQGIINFLVDAFQIFAESLIDQVIYYFHSRLILRAVAASVGQKSSGYYQRVGKVPIDVPLDNPWILVRNIKVKVNGKSTLSYWTRGIFNIGKIKTKLYDAIGKGNIAVLPFGLEQLAVQLDIDENTGEVKGIAGKYWIDMDDYRFGALVRYVPLGVFRQMFFVFRLNADGSYEYAPVILYTFINPDARLVNEETFKLALGEEYSAFMRAIQDVATSPKGSDDYDDAKEFLQKLESRKHKKDEYKIPERFYVPNWLIDCLRGQRASEIRDGSWSFYMLTYRDFYDYLKGFGIDPYSDVLKALEYSGLKVENGADLMNSKVYAGHDGLEIVDDVFQEGNELSGERGKIARFIMAIVRDPNFLEPPKSDKQSYTYTKDAYPVIRELTGIGENTDLRGSVSANFNSKLGYIFQKLFERNSDVLRERGSGYAKVMIVLAGDEVDLGDERFSVFGFIDPINFEKEKKYNLNELMGNPLFDVMLRALDDRIHDLSSNVNKPHTVDSVKVRMLVQMSILYAFRTALYYQVDIRDVEVLDWNGVKITLYDLVGVLKDLEVGVNRKGLNNFKDKDRYAGSVKFGDIVIEKMVNGRRRKIVMNAADLISILTGCNIRIQEDHVTRDGKRYRIGYVELPGNGHEGKVPEGDGNDDAFRIIQMGRDLSRPIESVLERAGYANADMVARLTLELLGHHGIVHPQLKSLLLLIDGLIKDEDGRKRLDTNVERDLVEMAYIMGEVESVKRTIEYKLEELRSIKRRRRLTPDEAKLERDLNGIIKELESISIVKKIRDAPAKKMYELLAKGRKINKVTIKLLGALYAVNTAAYEVLSNPKESLRNAFLLEVKAGAIVRLSMSFLKALIKASPQSFVAMLRDEDVKVAVGVLLSAVVLVLFSVDMSYLFEKKYGQLSKGLKEEADRYDSILLYIAYVLVGIGLFISVFGAPFHMGKDLVYAIGRQIGNVLGDSAELIWNMVAGFEIPFTGQTVFETVVSLALSGVAVSTAELLVSALYQAVKYAIEEFVMSWVDDFALDFICTVPIFF